jgi:single-strand DNA-binding protein
MKNRVQLIGNAGNDPVVKTLDGGRKVANLTIATHDSYKNDRGERIEQTEWHNIVAWGKVAEIVEKFVTKGKQIAVGGKLTHRSYDDKNGEKRYFTEVLVSEIMLL